MRSHRLPALGKILLGAHRSTILWSVGRTDWVAWHEAYDDPNSPHRQRLALIQGHIEEYLEAHPPGRLRAISMCAGDGRDLLEVLHRHPRRMDVEARLVEIDAELAGRGRAAARRDGLEAIEVVTGDASCTDAYEGAVPADLVLVCGVFGNVPPDSIENTVRRLPQLCAPGATVIWTRHRREPDLTPRIREWFGAASFVEVSFHAPTPNSSVPDGQWAWIGVGVHRYIGPPAPFHAGQRLFTFVDSQPPRD
jgi:hypothetical protein